MLAVALIAVAVLDMDRSRDTGRARGTEPSRPREEKEADGRDPMGPSVERAEPERGRKGRCIVAEADADDIALGDICLNSPHQSHERGGQSIRKQQGPQPLNRN